MKNRVLAVIILVAAALGAWTVSPALADRGGHRGRVAERQWVESRGFRGHSFGTVPFHHPWGLSPWAWGPRFHAPWWRPHSRAVIVIQGFPSAPWGREFVGGVIGGTAGGLLGATIGRGSGNAAAIVGGAVLGTLVGGGVGRSMDAIDRLYVAQALEQVPSREVLAWQNPDTETRYEVEPLGTYRGRDGRYCREYQAKALIGGEWQQIYGTACRQPDGSWEVVR